MSWINLSALWKIVVFGLIAGAGLPALFAGGLYTLSWGPRTGKLATAGADGQPYLVPVTFAVSLPFLYM